jgi:hypothetical protein
MFAVEDPLLALILRLVVDTKGNESTSQEFLKRQLKALRRHLARYPPEEHGTRTMEWIEQRAAQYRRDWERHTVAGRTRYLRCADCPLAELDAAQHCEIHEQWLYLLHRYLSGEISSREHLESALALLRESKERLRYRVASVAASATKTGEAKKKKKKKKKKKSKKKKEGKDTIRGSRTRDH